ncbi:MAG: ABC transporter permease [Candidatus Eremiobacteraeota bacterium]|nr:ABC transporter permease [Candidatus Eremiobacteraeota bacterium]
MTRILAYAAEAFEAIWRNRARSILTMLGMIIGTSSVIAVLGIGSAASAGIAGSLGAFGEPGLFVFADPQQDDPAGANVQYRDVATVAADDGDVLRYVFPAFQRNYTMRANGISYVGQVVSQQDHTLVPDGLTIREGRRIGADEVSNASHVALISQPLERRFFGDALGLGQIVRINGNRFTIIGVYDELKAGIFSNIGASDYIEIPYTTYHEIAPGPIDGLLAYAKPGVPIPQVQDRLFATLQHLHGARSKYKLQDATAFLQSFEAVIATVSLGITAIGGVALLVAGIGIMNIMLVSVTERTREIGIRKAIGGSRNDIVMQFLLEAVILSLLGGAIGTALGVSMALIVSGLVSSLLGPAPVPYLQIILIAAGFSSLVGVVFGTYPAMRAGRLDPIEALRS